MDLNGGSCQVTTAIVIGSSLLLIFLPETPHLTFAAPSFLTQPIQ